MITPTRIVIGTLGAAVAALGIALGVALATGDGSEGHMTDQAQGLAGMMSAMSATDSDAMLEHMKEVLGEDGFNRMQQHFQDHSAGASMSGMTDMDQMMHTMMAGMMAETPADSNKTLPPADPHHGAPVTTSKTNSGQ